MLNNHGDHDDQLQYLYQTYYKLVYGTAYRIVKNKEDSEEITQDSFRITFKNMARMKDSNHFRNYLLRVAYNDALKRAKENARRNSLFPTTINEEISSDVDSIGEAFEDIFFSQMLEDIPVKDREVIILAAQGYKLKEISNILKISLPYTKVKLHRTRKILWEKMEGTITDEEKESMRI
ncbi:sigma-70 family RNA polymerase sigma factor [Vallitalea pronyensis]|uniref:Sigma-70 family RNA polymerase sigma factor n=1 Tax=Vallitalea pronyensis TaxID=1348613 RepID=A0A8J8SIJ5_9FIRM|nr:sigma-70 family RNA polymerase sigma factor [Vallitalea pronyensis]QUI25000.1 sigma-70 family RNA polymerase sigma factor [Vallitalea pronyensis]